MKSRKLTCITAITLFAALAMPVQLAAQHTRYKLIDLGTLRGTATQALGINNKGWIVGWGTTTGDRVLHAFLWRKGTGMTDLGTLGGPNSQAIAVNDRGEIVGTSETNNTDPLGFSGCPFGDGLICLPFLWRDGLGMTALPTLGGNNGLAPGINNRSQIVGTAENGVSDSTCPTPQSQIEPVIWYKGQIQQLPLRQSRVILMDLPAR
jgi:probable HAF family extracellular repeat protein